MSVVAGGARIVRAQRTCRLPGLAAAGILPAVPQASVLIVDDTAANLLALGSLLKPLGLDVVRASSGAEALERAAERDFAVILLDVMMPGLGGPATLQTLRQMPRAAKSPVIFLTAYHPDAELKNRAYALSAFDFLEKPIDIDLLRAKVRAFVALHDQQQEIQRQAEALRAKDRHLGVLAHDLRSPLAAILTGAHRLREKVDPDLKDAAQRVIRCGLRMERLIDGMLQFALAAADGFTINPEPIDFTELCRDIALEVSDVYPQVAFEYNLPPAVMGAWDRPRLEQVITNLLSNAAKYGTGPVSVVLVKQDPWIVLTVENGGPAIPPEQLARYFEPFVRGNETQAGFGLGVYISRQIARAHGGDLTAESDARSTRFTARLPVNAPASRVSD